MDTFSQEQTQTQNIISLFGDPLIPREEIEEFNSDIEEAVMVKEAQEDIFSVKIANADTSLEAGFVILADQINELKTKMRRTSFYLTDLENLVT